MYGPATKHGNGYTYESSFVHAGGPTHPSPAKSALLTITTHGVIRMFWSQNTNRLEETTMELESISASDELITHASFASEKSMHPTYRIALRLSLTAGRTPPSRRCYNLKAAETNQNRDSMGPSITSGQGDWSARRKPKPFSG
jgi:hypothetical protein